MLRIFIIALVNYFVFCGEFELFWYEESTHVTKRGFSVVT